MNVQGIIKGLGNVSLKYLLHEKPQRLVNYRGYTSVFLVKGISRPPQCPSQMQTWIVSVGMSVTGALEASPEEHYCSLAATPVEMALRPCLQCQTPGLLVWARGSKFLPIERITIQALILNPSLALALPSPNPATTLCQVLP